MLVEERCIACRTTLPPILVRLGATRCHDCRHSPRCEDCHFRREGLCALADGPCPTFRPLDFRVAA